MNFYYIDHSHQTPRLFDDKSKSNITTGFSFTNVLQFCIQDEACHAEFGAMTMT